MVRQRAWDWQIAVFGQNEAPGIGSCLRSIAAASQGRRVLATVILNGTTDSSASVAAAASGECGLAADVHAIPHGDKSNAINRALRELRAEAHHHAYADAYAAIGPETFEAFESCLAENPAALAASGVGLGGRSTLLANREVLETGGVLRGQLHCLRASFIDRLVSGGLRLPVGLYRGDGLLGSMAAHDLDAPGIPWSNARIAGAARATFAIRPLSPLDARDLRRQFRRQVRQMRGRIENAAVKEIIYDRGYAGLPDDADAMIGAWLARHGPPHVRLAERPFLELALRQHRRARRPEADRLEATLLARIRP